jgi:hypothetical protein
MDLIPVNNTGGDLQSFWDTKYGTWWKRGALVTLGALVLVKLGPIIAYLTVIAGNLWVLGAHALGFFIVYKLITSDKFRKFVDIVLGSVGYYITDWFFGISPETSGKAILELLRGAIERVKSGVQTLYGKQEMTDNEIADCNKRIKINNTEITKIAKYAANQIESSKKGTDIDSSAEEAEISILKKEVERYSSLLEELVPFRTDLVGLINDLEKLARELDIQYRDRENELNFLLKKRSIMKDIGSVMNSMKQVLQGGNLAGYYEQIKLKVKNDNDQKVGEMKSFLKNLDPMISRIDRNNAIATKEARAEIEGFMSKSKLLTGTKVVAAIPHKEILSLNTEGSTDYANVLKTKLSK